MITNAANRPQVEFIRDRIIKYLRWNDMKSKRMILLYKQLDCHSCSSMYVKKLYFLIKKK